MPADFLLFSVCCISVSTTPLLLVCLCMRPAQLRIKKKKKLGKTQCDTRPQGVADTTTGLNKNENMKDDLLSENSLKHAQPYSMLSDSTEPNL